MELIDSIRQGISRILPRGHQAIVATLLSLLLIALALPDRPSVGSGRIVSTASVPAAQLDEALASEALNPEHKVEMAVEPGDNLSTIFSRVGLSAQQLQAMTESADDDKVLTDLRPGDGLVFRFSEDQELRAFEIVKTPLESFWFEASGASTFAFRHEVREPSVIQVFKEATITDSLFRAAQRSEIPDSYAMELATIFGGVVDFILDTREGDHFSVLYEEQFLDGVFIGYGRILAAEYVNQGHTFTAVRYENLAGETAFFNPEGESMRKAFELNPVDFTRISSGFSLARRHPILNTMRAHKGTDYAAPRGTPVVATADGRVTFVGRNGSFGKMVTIQHGERFVTKYAHLDSYSSGIKVGTRVSQRQVIGFVGATGGATGPHLHYEFLMDGVHRDSRRIFDQLPRAESVASGEMGRFRAQTRPLVSRIASREPGGSALATAHDALGVREE